MAPEERYSRIAGMITALSQPKRLQIVDMLSCGELCACEILEAFHITQPTLSYDMKVLTEAGIVKGRKDGKNTYYTLRQENLTWLLGELNAVCSDTPDCLCHVAHRGDC
ncbi:metalloregulator ArsR/SmtB family transcription factor [Corynebacterium glucuronolyticum]